MKFLPLELIQDAALIYDGRKEQKSFRRILRTTLSETLKPDVFLCEVKAVPASQGDGLQIADMLAGFVRAQSPLFHNRKIKIIEYPDLKQKPG